jgi:hypothetical protein
MDTDALWRCRAQHKELERREKTHKERQEQLPEYMVPEQEQMRVERRQMEIPITKLDDNDEKRGFFPNVVVHQQHLDPSNPSTRDSRTLLDATQDHRLSGVYPSDCPKGVLI